MPGIVDVEATSGTLEVTIYIIASIRHQEGLSMVHTALLRATARHTRVSQSLSLHISSYTIYGMIQLHCSIVTRISIIVQCL